VNQKPSLLKPFASLSVEGEKELASRIKPTKQRIASEFTFVDEDVVVREMQQRRVRTAGELRHLVSDGRGTRLRRNDAGVPQRPPEQPPQGARGDHAGARKRRGPSLQRDAGGRVFRSQCFSIVEQGRG